MNLFDLLLLSVALAMDCFTVSIMSGVIVCRTINGPIVRMAALFGVSQAVMPLLGWLATAHFRHLLEAVDHWVAFAMLAFIGGKMIKESFEHGDRPCFNPLKIRTQVYLALATSIDALAIGISMACMESYGRMDTLPLPLSLIGIVSMLFSLLGFRLGTRFGDAVARRLRPELVGGLVLLFIGVKVLLSHLLG